jgi:1-aminocyclopropane-1-carboxylate deaminase
MAFGVFDLIKKNHFPKGSKILLVHTGGLQGINGLEERFKRKIYE